jgi:hypothetical protein
MRERVDGDDDLGWVTVVHEVMKLQVSVLDRVVKHCDDLVGRVAERKHDPQRVEDVGLPLGG